MYYSNSSHSQSKQVVNDANFNGTYTLDNLRPYTEYSIYVTTVRLIGDTGRPLEGMKSETVTRRTLSGGTFNNNYLCKLVKSIMYLCILPYH